MYKSVLIIALTFVVAASANHDLERETGLLLGNEKLFTDYCMSARASIVQDLKTRASETSSGIFNVFFGAANEIADEVLTVERKAVEELSKQIEADSKNSPVSDEPLSEDKIQALIEEGKREIQNRGALGRVVSATKTAGSVLINTANSAIFVRLAKLRTQLNAGLMIRGIFNTCNQVNEYEQQLESSLEAAKANLKSENTESEVQTFIDSVTVPKLKCYTTKFVSRLNGFCELFKSGSGPFFKMLGVDQSIVKKIEENRV